jgi:hypothetical protein
MNLESKNPIEDMTVGGHVVFVDTNGVQHHALVTAIHGPIEDVPCINLVIASGDPSRQDQYGRQTERHSSVVHRSTHRAHGYYYMMPNETPNPGVPRQA